MTCRLTLNRMQKESWSDVTAKTTKILFMFIIWNLIMCVKIMEHEKLHFSDRKKVTLLNFYNDKQLTSANAPWHSGF